MNNESWTTHLTEIRREEDGERIGYLRPDSDGLWTPLNLLGMPLDACTDQAIAESIVREKGMSSLLGELWCRIPRPLVEEVTDARLTGDDSWWERVTVVEINSMNARVRPYYPLEEEQGRIVSVALPAHDLLKTSEPDESGM